MGNMNPQKKKKKFKMISLLILTLIVNLCSLQNAETIYAEEVWNIALKDGNSFFVNQMLDIDMFTFSMGSQIMENREQISMSPTVFTEAGINEIQFQYCNEEQELYIKRIQVDVQEIKEISISVKQNEIELIEGQEITKEMLPLIEVNYNNGTTKEVKDYEYIVDWVNQQIKIRYQNLEAIVKIKVLPNTIESIQVRCDLEQVAQDYVFTKKDLLVQAVYLNGEKKEIEEYQILPYKLVAGEESIISISYEGKIGNFKIFAKEKEQAGISEDSSDIEESKEPSGKLETSPEPESSKEPAGELETSPEPESSKEPAGELETSPELESSKEPAGELETSPELESSKESAGKLETSLEPESSKEPAGELETSPKPESGKESVEELETSSDAEIEKDKTGILEESTELNGKKEEIENNGDGITSNEEFQTEETQENSVDEEKLESSIKKETGQTDTSQLDNQENVNINSIVQLKETDGGKIPTTESKNGLQISGDLQFVSLEEADLELVYLNKNAELSFSELENVNYQVVEQKNSLTNQWISLKDGICFNENNKSSILYIQYKDDTGEQHILKSNPFIVDKKKPTISLRNKIYKKNIKIEANDTVGIRDIKLQGTINKKIKNGYKLKKEGKYKLIITDYAGNQKIIEFKLQKPAKKIELSFSLEKNWNKMKYKAKVTNTSRKVTWSTSNKNIASITTEGLLTAKKSGTVYVKAKIDQLCVKQKIVISTKTKSILVY